MLSEVGSDLADCWKPAWIAANGLISRNECQQPMFGLETQSGLSLTSAQGAAMGIAAPIAELTSPTPQSCISEEDEIFIVHEEGSLIDGEIFTVRRVSELRLRCEKSHERRF